MIDLRTPHDRCPYCGSYETHQRAPTAGIDLIIGSMVIAMMVTIRLAGKSSPILAPALLAGTVVGLACGVRLGSAVAGENRDRLAHAYNCHSCGEAFTR